MNIYIKKTVLSLGLIISVLAISERARVDASPPGLILNDAQINAVFSNPLAYRYQAARVAENLVTSTSRCRSNLHRESSSAQSDYVPAPESVGLVAPEHRDT